VSGEDVKYVCDCVGKPAGPVHRIALAQLPLPCCWLQLSSIHSIGRQRASDDDDDREAGQWVLFGLGSALLDPASPQPSAHHSGVSVVSQSRYGALHCATCMDACCRTLTSYSSSLARLPVTRRRYGASVLCGATGLFGSESCFATPLLWPPH
jgi:hypothetical protein